MPAVLRDFGLSEALEQLISDIEDSSQIKVLFFNELENSGFKLEKDQQVYIYRVVQEAINNAIKHAQCDEIQLSITVFDDHLALYIKDNGIGFDVGKKEGFSGLGLRNIEERVRLMGGSFYIESEKTGTGIEIEIPIS
jgi:signal transduction histidine kinase